MARSEDFNREVVLDRAKHLFWLKGYNGTSMQDLVDATGLNRSSIYNSFGNKMDLYQQALTLYIKERGDFREKAVGQQKNAIETIGLLFLYTMKAMVGDPDKKGSMLINCRTEFGQTDESIATILDDYEKEFLLFVEAIVEKGQREGTIRKDEHKTVFAHYLVTAYQGFRITGMNTNDEKMLKAIILNILKTIS